MPIIKRIMLSVLDASRDYEPLNLMVDSTSKQSGTKKEWTLTSQAFHRLIAWLDDGANSDGRMYIEMRRRLVSYFDRKNCSTPDDLADETLNRVARRLEEEGDIETDSPAKYCYTVARFVFLEHLRAERRSVGLSEAASGEARVEHLAALDAEEREQKERMLDCLGRCVDELEPTGREIITRYYAGTGRAKIEARNALARDLKITQNALSIRACRIRSRLEECVRSCMGRR